MADACEHGGPHPAVPDLADWLLEQIAEDERVAQAASPPWHPWSDPLLPECAGAVAWGEDIDGYVGGTWGTHAAVWNPWRVLADCEAKRRIVEWHKAWPVLVETEPEFTSEGFSVQLSKRIAWLTQRQYVEQFGSEPPTAPILKLLALPFADRPGYDEEWRP